MKTSFTDTVIRFAALHSPIVFRTVCTSFTYKEGKLKRRVATLSTLISNSLFISDASCQVRECACGREAQVVLLELSSMLQLYTHM